MYVFFSPLSHPWYMQFFYLMAKMPNLKTLLAYIKYFSACGTGVGEPTQKGVIHLTFWSLSGFREDEARYVSAG